MHANFHINQILFTIQPTNSSFMHYLVLQKIEFKQLINGMAINI